MREFVYASHSSRVVFGAGTLQRLRAEVEHVGGTRALILTTPRQASLAALARDELGPLAAGEFTGAAMHTPVDVTERALAVLRDVDADCLVALGGGSTTGLSKALAVRTGLPQVVVATTYAGSEVTPVLGETENGVKTTRSSPSILPETVVYDVNLTLGLPVPLTVTSGVNAMAHAVEALYAPQSNPATDALALRSISLLAGALPRIAADPGHPAARAEALEAAWLAGTCLGTVGMALHHKLCHTLGGSFGLPHAETHTVVLPHAMAYNAPSAPEAMRRIADALGAADAPTAVYDLVASLGGPLSLRDLGLAQTDLPRAVDLATATPYPNPREVTPEGMSALLREAWAGRRPASAEPLAETLRILLDQVTASFEGSHDPRVQQLLTDLVRRLHGFVADNDLTDDEWRHAIDFLTRTGQLCGPTRQEFILLSDTLGVSSAVDVLTNSRTAHSTPSAVLGPFYVEGPPPRDSGDDIAEGLDGAPLYADVRITDIEGAPVADAVVDVWQSNADGFYDVQLPDLEGPVLRARFRSDAVGRLTFWSILPCEYPIPDDGPVGRMLKATGRHPYRAPHLHFMISAPGMRTLITQLFVAGGAYIDGDTVFGVKEALVVDYPEHKGPTPDGRSLDGSWHSLDYTFRLARTA
ncbi:maleylacetate reductase and hydroxyquinol 1,2-dioxygenase domain-containing protein [Streptomyces sp. NBC_01275]|uniref:maleylacetate reductase and hydroxyquinol 1,2-dioxygenase domain-containing protein n=1 Tax=Streptomyces sp. NBC_01275 TaxID=2903807 RepID=UPI00224CEB37|nr:maleylacetate reductase and hydroxyquinol 1,2-dioxygenase domain-containing protein [Streptomyces sp. NBC_01275]MCX4767269.1 maleylacetate reductase and hydroxyquinol 1,2-dioxygenase domain-containing protein [Streptomyces sp. NBC_01275]